jgi:hypothetical protein
MLHFSFRPAVVGAWSVPKRKKARELAFGPLHAYLRDKSPEIIRGFARGWDEKLQEGIPDSAAKASGVRDVQQGPDGNPQGVHAVAICPTGCQSSLSAACPAEKLREFWNTISRVNHNDKKKIQLNQPLGYNFWYTPEMTRFL